MFFPGLSKTVPNVPMDLRESVVMAIRVFEGNSGKNVELVGRQPASETGFEDIKYRTKKFKDAQEVERIRLEMITWIEENPERFQIGLEFLKTTFEPLIKMAQKAGLGPKVS
ncbi:MAG TPA: hypothetical protein DEF34_10245 [Desulfotomaculum sp.]|nr:MAG: hypothetical protein JL56_05810 [Desulfotomaculum sp. BICA1-6]HBX23994.1 hypothetical protein [Desulfotomaculum sp.]